VVREVLTPERLSRLEPREAAAYFIMRRTEGFASGEEQLFTSWLARDETHRRMYDSADRAWRSFADAEGNEILAAMREQALAPRPRFTAVAWRAVTAAALLLLFAGSALFFVPGLNPWAPQLPRAIQYATVRGKVKDLRLPDGSSMTLDADSIAVGQFVAGGRGVQLQRGRAFFEVVRDPSHPFAVTAAGRSIVVVGTRFDVNLLSDGLAVTLLDGRVTIGSVTLEPGQQYLERSGQATIRTIGAASENVTGWRTGLVNFADQSLTDAAAVMNRYSREQIVITDPGVASIRVSGQFRAGEAQRFAATVAELHKLRVLRRADEIELVR
jgi:transmembrane sensor